ncbi:MAG TPA: beta-galactosidase GalA [Candidatus Sulfotelmatobacter sp.]
MTECNRRDVLRSGLVLSAGSVLLNPRFAVTQALFDATLQAGNKDGLRDVPMIDLSPREQLLFDFNWRFFQGHGTDPARDLGFGKSQGDFAKTGEFEFALAKFNDTSWRVLNLPHDWAVELPFVNDKELESHGFKPLGRSYPETSVGWYRRVFDVPKSDQGRRVFLDFDGAFRSALVFCNGNFIGRNDNGYAPFRFDLTDFLFYGGKNCITVRMDASFGDGWFYEGAGIYRHVWLTKTDALHLGQWDTVVRTEMAGKDANLKLSTIVENSGESGENCRVRWQILDGTGKTVATAESAATEVGAHGKQSFSATAKLAHAALWSPEEPNLYYAIAVVEAGGTGRDRDQAMFGVRTVEFDVNRGFFLNGQSTPIQGTCNHQDHAGVGAALPDQLQDFRVEVLKGMGCNAVRTSHNMPTPEWVEACTRAGVLMLCETRLMSSNEEGLAQLETMVKRYRNNPAVFLWSMGNEEWVLQANDIGPRVLRTMQERAHELDPTRLCTSAVNGSYDKPFPTGLEVMGFNYNLGAIDKYHASHPRQPAIGTETASTVSTRGIYSTDKLRNWVSAYDVNHTDWSELAEQWWTFYAARPWLSGGFAWTGFDYRGEPTPYSWPSVSSQFGIVDTCGFPKDNYFYYKAWWGKEPALHLFPHWNWAGKEGEEISVWVHSNLESVELFCNGQSMGSKKVEPLHHLEWKVNYAPGYIEARGSKDSKVVLTVKRETTGAPSKIRLTAHRQEIAADGEDVAIVRVETVDSDGRFVPIADNHIKFKVSGEGALIGVGNGDPNCQESDKGSERSLFSGLAQAILQASKTPGSITIEATSNKLEAASLSITTKPTKLRPAVG